MTRHRVQVGVGAVLSWTATLLSGCGSGGGGGGGGPLGPTPAPTPDPSALVPSPCPPNFKRGHCTKCVGDGKQYECQECSAPYTLNSDKKGTSNACAYDCKKFNSTRAKPPMPDTALSLNGVEWPSACFDEGGDSEHFFVIGDWGGMCGGWDATMNDCTRNDWQGGFRPKQALPGKPFPMNNLGGTRDDTDYKAGAYVASRMMEKAKKLTDAGKPPRFVVNVGDNFYPGGVMEHCSLADAKTRAMSNKQFAQVFEAMYPIKDLGNIEWMSVLGNHDYGGVCYTMGWDQQIYYTWKEGGRWVMPAQHWNRKVQFKNFDAEFWFLDNNLADAKPSNHDTRHNICGYVGNPDGGGPGGDRQNAHCAEKAFPPSAGQGEADCPHSDGPHNPDDCYRWFQQRWGEQYTWLVGSLKKSTADWQLAVTHYPAEYSIGATQSNHVFWPTFAAQYGIDIIIAGHVHLQEVNYKTGIISSIGRRTGVDMGDVAWVVSGGGGGITSEGIAQAAPKEDGHDDGYGFMDMEISLESIKITAISHGGKDGAYVVRNQTTVYPIPPNHPPPSSALNYRPPEYDDADELVV